jgi:hypothetical protein
MEVLKSKFAQFIDDLRPILEKNVFSEFFASEKVKKWLIRLLLNALYDSETKLHTFLYFFLSLSLSSLSLPKTMTWYTAVDC